ncbi:MAG: RimK/LysX family protein [Phycisphaeraceae bacterium]
MSSEKPIIGWREWLTLPDLNVPAIKAKVDTGARSSAMHAYDMQTFMRRGVEMVRFVIHPYQRDTERTVPAEAKLVDRRWVRSSGGQRTWRPVIHTRIQLGDDLHDIELTLVNRDEMGFRMLLGRQAVRHRFMVDPARSYVLSKHMVKSRKIKRRRREP